ncbi:MAG: PAS domain S-box protein [Pseudomonadota bacterium]
MPSEQDLQDVCARLLEVCADVETLCGLGEQLLARIGALPGLAEVRLYLPEPTHGRVGLLVPCAAAGEPPEAAWRRPPPEVVALLCAPGAAVACTDGDASSGLVRWLVPLRYRRETVGVLDLACDEPGPPGPARERWLLHLGQIVGGIAQDLLHARELRRLEIELRSITCSATDAIILADGEGRITFWNWAAEQVFGYTQGEALGQDLHRILAPDDYFEAYQEGFRRFRGTGEGIKIGQVVELLARRRDGSEFPVEISVTAVDGGEGPLVVGIVRDISERWRSEQQLRASEARYRGIVEDQTELICRYRPDGTLTFVNDAWCRYFGLAPDEVLGQAFELDMPEEDRQLLDATIQGLGADQPVAAVEHRVELPDGRVRWLHWTDRAVCDEHGAVIEYQAVGRDTTKRREAERALMRAREDLERRVVERTQELSQANEALVREVAERRRAERALLRYQEQLRSMSSQLSLAEERERRRIATAVHDDIGQCLALCRMKVSALAQRAPASAGSVGEIGALLDDAIHNTRTLTFELSTPILYDLGLVAAVEWLCEQVEAQHDLRFELKAPARALDLDTDLRVLLFRGVRELLHNTVKHALASHVWIRIQVGRGRIRVVVEDDGVGFPEGFGATSATGFGLFAIRERVNALGGTFRVGRRRGGGASVLQSVPFAM